MKGTLILTILFCWITSLVVLAHDDTNIPQLLSKDNKYSGPARDLPRSERKRLRLLKVLSEHRIKKRDLNENDDFLLPPEPVKKISLTSRGNIKAVDTFKRNSNENLENFSGGLKNFEFAYNVNNHHRKEKLEFTRNPKELKSDSYKNPEDETETIAAKGSFSFISADGFKYTTKYVADDKGFRPIVLVEKI